MTQTPDIWMLHTTNPREGESSWGGCYIVETDAHNDAATMRKATGLDWKVVPMVRADSLGKCLHQIAEPAEYPHLPTSVADVVDFSDGRGVDVDFSSPAPAGGASLYTADQMRAYVDADRAQRAAAPQAVQAAVPEGWVPCVITYEGQHPEEIAYGPQAMMDRLKKWLDRYFEIRTAPAHPAEEVPAQDERKDLVPGVMRCAKCEFQLVRAVLAVNVGQVFAGDSKTEPCPNGCGPLWPVTWKQYANQAMNAAEVMSDRAFAAEKELSQLRAATQPAAQGMDAQQYRLLDHGELIEAGDEFLRDDFTWQIDPNGLFVGCPLGRALRPARRAIAAQAKQGGA